MSVIWTVFWLNVGLSEAQASEPVEVAVMGIHATQQSDDAAEMLADAVDALPSMSVVPVSVLKTQLNGSGSRIVTDALQAEGLAMLAEGRILFEQADLEPAKTRIGEAVVSLESALAGDTWRCWGEEHERTEGEAFARAAADQVEKDGTADGQCAEQKPWCKEAHRFS